MARVARQPREVPSHYPRGQIPECSLGWVTDAVPCYGRTAFGPTVVRTRYCGDTLACVPERPLNTFGTDQTRRVAGPEVHWQRAPLACTHLWPHCSCLRRDPPKRKAKYKLERTATGEMMVQVLPPRPPAVEVRQSCTSDAPVRPKNGSIWAGLVRTDPTGMRQKWLNAWRQGGRIGRRARAVRAPCGRRANSWPNTMGLKWGYRGVGV